MRFAILFAAFSLAAAEPPRLTDAQRLELAQKALRLSVAQAEVLRIRAEFEAVQRALQAADKEFRETEAELLKPHPGCKVDALEQKIVCPEKKETDKK